MAEAEEEAKEEDMSPEEMMELREEEATEVTTEEAEVEEITTMPKV